jgi:hypothetical protein
MRPKTGGRVELRLVRAADVVEYAVELAVPDAEWQGTARLDAAGAVTLDGVDGAPAWLADYARAFLRSEWRARQGPDPAPWPDRIGRWRGES